MSFVIYAFLHKSFINCQCFIFRFPTCQQLEVLIQASARAARDGGWPKLWRKCEMSLSWVFHIPILGFRLFNLGVFIFPTSGFQLFYLGVSAFQPCVFSISFIYPSVSIFRISCIGSKNYSFSRQK